VILSQWDWNRVVWLAPWKDVLTFLVWPVLSAQPYVYQSESDLHHLMRAAWSAASVPVRHEVSLGRGLRIDFTSRGVGVEVKIAGQPVEVRKQLQRYAASGRLQALVLFTGVSWPPWRDSRAWLRHTDRGNRSVGRPVTVGPPEGAPPSRTGVLTPVGAEPSSAYPRLGVRVSGQLEPITNYFRI
jgi:hypothetical protein